MRSRVMTLMDAKKAKKEGSKEFEDELPPLPEKPPSIHDHEAYREYMRLKRMHRRQNKKKEEPVMWTRPSPRGRVKPDFESESDLGNSSNLIY